MTSPRSSVVLGPFIIFDGDRPALLEKLEQRFIESTRQTKPLVMFSLHVGGLNLRKDAAFTQALSHGDLLVPDGVSVALLARLAGAQGMHRHPTTDAGWEIIDHLADESGPIRIALLGGPEGLAEEAGVRIEQQSRAKTVYTAHGYHNDWSNVLSELRASKPSIIFVGMGMPQEALWVASHLADLPPALVVTCGGWFGYITGQEKRAPAWMRKSGIEWMARLAQSPGRLWQRYAGGLWATLAMIPVAMRDRRKNS